MILNFVQEAVYLKYKGEYYSQRILYEDYWNRYLNHFDHVNVMARVKSVDKLEGSLHLSSGPNITFIELPYYNGLIGYFKKRSCLKKTLLNQLHSNEAYILRIPGPIGNLFAKILKKNEIKYVVEVVGDPHEVLMNFKMQIFIKRLLAQMSLHKMKKIVSNASGALYVTNKVLQTKYPKNSKAFTVSASNVIIKPENLIARNGEERYVQIKQRLKNHNSTPIKIGVLGMLYPIKSPLNIVRATKILIDQGLNIDLFFAGEGPLQAKISQLADSLSINNNVHCVGSITDVIDFLDSIDIFVQFSKTEGMPRAVLEAMSRGCPVVSSDVGGVPELLPEKFLVRSGDTTELAKKIKNTITNKRTYVENVDNSFAVASAFTLTKLNKKRAKFYENVKLLYKL